MIHLRMIGMAITAIFIFLLTLAGLQKRKNQRRQSPDIGDIEHFEDNDSIIGLSKNDDIDGLFADNQNYESAPSTITNEALTTHKEPVYNPDKIIIINILAQPDKLFLGYELLQALLSVGMRFGEMNIFHRYEEGHDKSRVLFSLASATEPGVFDIQKMGATTCKGLCLFMPLTGRLQDDDVLSVMLDTVEQLASDLDGIVTDQFRKPLTPKTIAAYREMIRECSMLELAEDSIPA